MSCRAQNPRPKRLGKAAQIRFGFKAGEPTRPLPICRAKRGRRFEFQLGQMFAGSSNLQSFTVFEKVFYAPSNGRGSRSRNTDTVRSSTPARRARLAELFPPCVGFSRRCGVFVARPESTSTGRRPFAQADVTG